MPEKLPGDDIASQAVESVSPKNCDVMPDGCLRQIGRARFVLDFAANTGADGMLAA